MSCVHYFFIFVMFLSSLSWEASCINRTKPEMNQPRALVTNYNNALLNDQPKNRRLQSPTRLFPTNQLESYDAVNGSRVELPCHIEFKLAAAEFTNVSWLKMPRRILTRGALRVTRDHRIHLLPQSVTSTSEFPLIIDPVREQDAGEYRCLVQIGSKLHHKVVILVVKVPPYFEERPPRIAIADERGNLRLFCNVSGTPKPKLRWWVLLGEATASARKPSNFRMSTNPYQSDASEKAYLAGVLDQNVNETWGDLHSERGRLKPIETILARHKNHIFVRGGLLVFSQIHRQMTGWYFCEARNGIPPSAISESRLLVRYVPEVKMSHTELQQYLGRSTIIGCTIQAYPVGSVEWELNGIPIDTPYCREYPSVSVKYCQVESHNLAYSRDGNTEAVENEPHFLRRSSMGSTQPQTNRKEEEMIYRLLESRLTVNNITHADLGVYTCRMRNSAGVGEGYTRLESHPRLHSIQSLYATTLGRFSKPNNWNLFNTSSGKRRSTWGYAEDQPKVNTAQTDLRDKPSTMLNSFTPFSLLEDPRASLVRKMRRNFADRRKFEFNVYFVCIQIFVSVLESYDSW